MNAMNRSIRLAAAFLLAATATAAFPQNIAWTRSLYGPGGTAMALSDGRVVTRTMAADGAGNVFVVGSGSIAGGGRSALATKLDAATGNTLWQKNFGTTDAVATGVALDAAGNAYVIGYTYVSASNVDVVVVKYAAADGSLLWQRTFDSGTSDYAYALAVDASGNVVVGAEVLNAAGNTDIKVLDYAAADGTLAWQQTIDGGRDDFVTDLSLDGAGNVLVAGVSVNAAGNSDMRVAKLAGTTGAIAWNRAIDNGAADEAFAIAADAAGNAYVAGYFTVSGAPSAIVTKFSGTDGTILWERGMGTGSGQSIAVDGAGNVVMVAQVTGPGGHDFRTAKFATDGTAIWDKTFDSGGDDFAYQVALDANGNATVVGTSNTGGNYDWRAIQYAAADGSMSWTSHYNGTGDGTDENYGVALGGGAVYLGGTSVEQGKPSGLRVAKLASGSTMAAGGRRSNADFDGDLRADLLWTLGDGSVRAWLMKGATAVDSAVILGPGSGWKAIGTGDLDGDGKADIAWTGPNGAAGVWLMDGLTPRSATQILAGGTGWTLTAVADFDGDGKADLLWTHANGAVALWLMDGLTPRAGAQVLDPGSGWKVATVGDLDGDGKADLLLTDASGTVAGWFMNGTQVRSSTTYLTGGSGWLPVATGDLDGDGIADIVWTRSDGSAAVWLMNGATVKSGSQILGPGTGWTPRKVADFDGDGTADIAWDHTDGSVGLWFMKNGAATSATTLLGAGNPWKLN